ncbi:MAG: Hpt domain-containing protein [Pseudomonadota bacterium]
MPEDTEPTLDTSVLEEIHRSTSEGDFIELISEFVEAVERLAGEVAAAQKAVDIDRLERAAHEMAGMVTTFGAMRLGKAARSIMLDCRGDETDRALAQTSELHGMIDEALAALSERFPGVVVSKA